MISVPQPEVHAIALAIYHEARNQPQICQLWVGSVVKYRMQKRKLNAMEVIAEGGQFTWYRHRTIIKEPAAYWKSFALAKKVMDNPLKVKYEYFNRGSKGGVKCGDQVFSATFNR